MKFNSVLTSTGFYKVTITNGRKKSTFGLGQSTLKAMLGIEPTLEEALEALRNSDLAEYKRITNK